MTALTLHPITGGIHPEECKSRSNQLRIQTTQLPKQLVIPLQQHIGAPAIACVQVGEKVQKGQLIAQADGHLSLNIHASSSGTVVAIEQRPYPHPSGQSCLAIVIETDRQDQWCELSPKTDYQQLDKLELLEFIRTAGISGMGGAGFPTAIKLAPKQPIHTLIINGTECEPYITADDLLMREQAPQIVAGIQIIQHLLGATQVLIGIEDNKPQAIQAMQQACLTTDYQVAALPTVYPSGGEKQLIQILTGQEVPSGNIPADLGMVCQNVGTVFAVYQRVMLGQPVVSRVTTITGDAVQQAANYQALIGTPITDLLTQAQLSSSKLASLIIGGPMMGFELQDSHAPIIITSNCIIAASAEELPTPAPALPCIRCGDCAAVCPTSLLPQQLHFFAQGEQHQQLLAHNLFDCIECGACAYVCPSNIPLVQYYRAAKGEIRLQQRKQRKAEQAKEHFEARQARLAEEEQRKQQERQERAARIAAQATEPAATNKPAVANTTKTDDAAKKLKIELSMAKVALKKAQKQFSENPSDALQAQIDGLQQQLQTLQQQLDQLSPATSPAASNDEQIKRLKIEASMSQAALKKAEKQLAEYGSAELKAQVEMLQHTAEQAQTALNNVLQTSKSPVTSDPEQKKLKIELAMAKAALKKAQKAEQTEQHIAELQAMVDQAQERLDQLNSASQPMNPAPAVPAKAIDSDHDAAIKKAKIELAMAKAALRKAQANQADNEQLTLLTANLEQKQQQLDQLNQVVPIATSAAPVTSITSPAIKQAKVTLAMHKAALRKAETAQADAQQLALLRQAVEQAEQQLSQLTSAS